VQAVARPAAGGPDGTRDDRRPDVEIVLGVADDGRAAGRAGRRVDPANRVVRDGEHPERIVLAEVGLRRRGEVGEVRECLDVVGVHTGGVEGPPVVGDVVVGVAQTPAQSLQLKRA
jgi:hypothetical protein